MELMKENLASLEVRSEAELIKQYLPTHPNAAWVELGCGDAAITKSLAECFPTISIKAFEVDGVQHEKNVTSSGTPGNLTFALGGMQLIDVPDSSVDGVIMLKCLHHVPTGHLNQGFREVHRILKPGGTLFVSEPVFTGEFHQILRHFHDDRLVRKQAFLSLQDQVEMGQFELKQEIHFASYMNFPRGFVDFEDRVLHATHATHNLSDETVAIVKEQFAKHVKEDGSASFLLPIRLDVLAKV